MYGAALIGWSVFESAREKEECDTMKWIAYLLPLWLVVASVSAQEKVRVDVGVDITSPGQTVFLPVTFSAPEGVQVRGIILELSFPSQVISFAETIMGTASQSAGAEIKEELLQSEGGEEEGQETILRLDISAPGPIPNGELLRLGLEVSHSSETNNVVKIRNLKPTAISAGGEELEAEGVDGIVTVFGEGEVVFACFFYMH